MSSGMDNMCLEGYELNEALHEAVNIFSRTTEYYVASSNWIDLRLSKEFKN